MKFLINKKETTIFCPFLLRRRIVLRHLLEDRLVCLRRRLTIRIGSVEIDGELVVREEGIVNRFSKTSS